MAGPASWNWPSTSGKQPRSEGADHPELLDHLARLSVRYAADGRGGRGGPPPGPAARLGGAGYFLLGEIQEFVDNPAGVVEAARKRPGSRPDGQGRPFAAAHYRKLLARSLLELGRPAEAREPLGGTADRRAIGRSSTPKPTGSRAAPISSRADSPKPPQACAAGRLVSRPRIR